MKFIWTILGTRHSESDTVIETDPEYGWEVGTAVSEDRVRECFDRDLDLGYK